MTGKGGDFRIAGGSDGAQVFLGLLRDDTEAVVQRMTPENYEVLTIRMRKTFYVFQSLMILPLYDMWTL